MPDQFEVRKNFVLRSIALDKEVSQDFMSTFSLVNVPTYNPPAPQPVFSKPYCIYKPILFSRHFIPLAITSIGLQNVMYKPFLALYFRGTVGPDQQYEVDYNSTATMARLQGCGAFIDQQSAGNWMSIVEFPTNQMLQPGRYQFGGFEGRPSELVYLELND